MSEEKRFKVEISQEQNFRFNVDFGIEGIQPFFMDEPEPIGSNSGPNASKVLAAVMANCLAASLMFCLQKSHVKIDDMKATAQGLIRRNKNQRWRIAEITVDLYPKVSEEKSKQLERCKEIFHDFCVVSQSIKQGIPVKINVHS